MNTINLGKDTSSMITSNDEIFVIFKIIFFELYIVDCIQWITISFDVMWFIGQTTESQIDVFLISLLIIITALVIKFTGFLLIDPILGMAFGFVLVWASWGILRDSMHLLMEGTPNDVSLRDVKQNLETVDGVADAHHVHAWALTSGKYVFSAHLRIRDGGHPQEILKAAHQMLRERFGFFFVTLQVEDRCIDESDAEAIDITAGENHNQA